MHCFLQPRWQATPPLPIMAYSLNPPVSLTCILTASKLMKVSLYFPHANPSNPSAPSFLVWQLMSATSVPPLLDDPNKKVQSGSYIACHLTAESLTKFARQDSTHTTALFLIKRLHNLGSPFFFLMLTHSVPSVYLSRGLKVLAILK